MRWAQTIYDINWNRDDGTKLASYVVFLLVHKILIQAYTISIPTIDFEAVTDDEILLVIGKLRNKMFSVTGTGIYFIFFVIE